MGFLAGKTAIITGAGYAKLSNGRCGSIGYGIATAYAKEGANLVITGRNVKKLTDAKEELERLYGVKVVCVQADVNDSADNEAVVNNVVKQAIDTFGRIDVLINNAQASASGVPLADHTTEQFNLALYSGLYATFYYMKACYPYLKETKGAVINFASGAGLFGNYGQCAYAAAKEGIRGLTRVAATEWGKDGINVNVVCSWLPRTLSSCPAKPSPSKAAWVSALNRSHLCSLLRTAEGSFLSPVEVFSHEHRPNRVFPRRRPRRQLLRRCEEHVRLPDRHQPADCVVGKRNGLCTVPPSVYRRGADRPR